MSRVHEVALELVRPGPPHNQLLSPLTTYMALCGDGSPTTLRLQFEHRKLLNRLERLRYVTSQAGGYVAVAAAQREAEVRDLGEEMGKVFASIPSVNAELSRTRSPDSSDTAEAEFLHLRLILSGSELSLLPFELAVAPQGYPGEGQEFSLQGSRPVVITREIRRSRPLPVSWNAEEPKILFISAAPDGMHVPTAEHVVALKSALGPWIKSEEEIDEKDSEKRKQKRLEQIKKRLRILPNATIDSIYAACKDEQFTHIHILAHGDHYQQAGEDRFGIALCRNPVGTAKDVVSGDQLARALRAEGKDGVARSQPIVVTLATCDSGHPGSVLVPGGSIAHDLHAAGIPWVFASQFPLTKPGSIRMANFLYPRLLRGDDPRQVTYEMRRTLSTLSSKDHDWASIVVYASLSPDFNRQVNRFFEGQMVSAIEVQMSLADTLARRMATGGSEAEHKTSRAKMRDALEIALDRLEFWQKRMPTGTSIEERVARVNCFGMKGSTLKRISLLQAELLDDGSADKSQLEAAFEAYRVAMDEWVTEESKFNWTAGQYLALGAVLGKQPDAGILAICRRIAQRDAMSDKEKKTQGWAHGTLAELELLKLFHESPAVTSDERVKVQGEIVGHCQQIVDLMGWSSFHVDSTRRQFDRYVNRWKLSSDDWKRNEWLPIAKAAVMALTPPDNILQQTDDS